MTRYCVEITHSAEVEIAEAYRYAAAAAPIAAERWYCRLIDAIQSLCALPNAHPRAPESNSVSETVRQLIFGRKPSRWRVLFIVRRDTVYVLHFRRGARRRLSGSELHIPPVE